MFGCTLDLGLRVGASEDASGRFLEDGLRDVDLYRVHLVDHSLRVGLEHGHRLSRGRRLLEAGRGRSNHLLFQVVSVWVLLLLLLEGLDGVDRAH